MECNFYFKFAGFNQKCHVCVKARTQDSYMNLFIFCGLNEAVCSYYSMNLSYFLCASYWAHHVFTLTSTTTMIIIIIIIILNPEEIARAAPHKMS